MFWQKSENKLSLEEFYEQLRFTVCRGNSKNTFWILVTFIHSKFFNSMTNVVGDIVGTCHWLGSRIIENSRIFQTYLHELSSPRLPWGKVGKNKFQLNWHKRPFPGRKMRVGGHLYWTLRWTFHKQFLSIWLLHIIVEPWYMAACTTVRPREFVPSGGPPFSIKSQPIKKSTRY